MKKLQNKLTESLVNKIILAALGSSLILIVITYFLKLSMPLFIGLEKSIWSSASFKVGTGNDYFSYVALFLVFLFILAAGLYIYILFRMLMKKPLLTKAVNIAVYFNISIIFILFFLNIFLQLYFFSFWFIAILNTILNGVAFFILKIYESLNKEQELPLEDDSKKKFQKKSTLIVSTLSFVFLLLTVFIPFVTRKGVTYTLFNVFKSSDYEAEIYIFATVMFILYFVSFMEYIKVVSSFLSDDVKYFKKSRNFNNINLVITALFFVFGFGYVFYSNIKKIPSTTVSYIPLLMSSILYIVYSYLQGSIKDLEKDPTSEGKPNKDNLKVLPLIFVLAFTVITVCSMFVIFIKIDYQLIENYSQSIKFTGLQLFKDYSDLADVFQVMAFIYGTLIFISVALLLLCVINYLCKSRDYYKLIKGTVYTNVIFVFLLSLFGLFFAICQKMMAASIETILVDWGVYVPNLYTYEVKSTMFFVFIIAFILLIVMILTRQLNYTVNPLPAISEKAKPKRMDNEALIPNATFDVVFDPCPAFSDIDSQKVLFDEFLKYKQKNLFENPNLPGLVNFIVNYARDSRLHLSYTYEDIATFVSGLGAARLTILQGMSGTGKTSLPKIFAEAIMGNCEIVEVESSWRDKNELLGYYNEFSNRFTPKKFTQCLYKARLNPDIPTLIVLDEMNLSRIEYYFSDFLSLMEAEENKREIKLLNVKLFPLGDDDKTSYIGLKDGHTLEISPNVWFVGTANRDESTFEISDKVYDRAQTMNFYKRAPKVQSYREEMSPRFISYETLAALYDQAKQKVIYDVENDAVIMEVEKLLAPYNISFGNRVLNQMEDFVKIYCACFANLNIDANEIIKTAVETILFSKIVSKLEFKQIYNKEKLAVSFDKLQLYKCSTFIRKLIED